MLILMAFRGCSATIPQVTAFTSGQLDYGVWLINLLILCWAQDLLTHAGTQT